MFHKSLQFGLLTFAVLDSVRIRGELIKRPPFRVLIVTPLQMKPFAPNEILHSPG